MLDPLASADPLGPSDPAPPDDRGAIHFRRRRDVGEVLAATFAFLRENGRELAWGLVVIIGPAVVVSTMLSGLFQREFAAELGGLAGGGAADPAGIMRVVASPYYLAAVAIGLITPILASAVVFAYVRLYRDGQAGAITPGALWAETSHLLWPVFSISLVFLAAFLLVVVPCLGALAVLVGFFVFLPVLILAPVARAMEAGGVGDAVRRTRLLAQGEWVPTVGVGALAWLVFIGIAAVFSIPNWLLAFSGGPLNAPGWAMGVWGLVAAFVVYTAYAIPTLAATFQFFSLVEQKEGRSPMGRPDALDAPPTAPRPDASIEEPPSSPPPQGGFRRSGFDRDEE